MTQVLTVCRIGTEWGFRDVTGAEYGHSADINLAVETAQGVAQRAGGHVVFTAEAEQHYRDLVSTRRPVDSPPAVEAHFPGHFRNLLARLTWWRRLK